MLEAFGDAFPQIDPLAFVHDRAVLIGAVMVGPQSSIWPNTTLRGDDGPILIGEKTSVQDGTTIHCTEHHSKTTIGSRVTVGHNVILHGCTIEDDCLIGMGSIILDNAVVERGAVVGAGTLVPPGKIVRAGTLVMGNPFALLRECSAKDQALIQFSWMEYVKRAEQYRLAAQAKGRATSGDRAARTESTHSSSGDPG